MKQFSILTNHMRFNNSLNEYVFDRIENSRKLVQYPKS